MNLSFQRTKIIKQSVLSNATVDAEAMKAW